MKVTLQYDPQDDETDDLETTLRITLPAKWLDGPVSKVRDTFVEKFNQKHPDCPIALSDCRLELDSGAVLSPDAIVSQSIADNAKLLLKRGSRSPSAPVAAAAPVVAAAAAPAMQGNAVTCKRFGCGKKFVPGEPTECRYHKKPPVFHETRKYWACCPDKVAWDWDSFTAIPGCCTDAEHSTQDPKTKIMGGTELRAEKMGEAGPQQIVEKTGLEKLSALRSALVAVGVDGGVFDRARDASKAALMETEDDAGKVWDRVCASLGATLAQALKQA